MSTLRRCIVCDSHGPFKPIFTATAGWTMVRCPRCGLVFQDPQPPEEVLAASYYHDPEFSELLLGELRELTLRRAREKLTLLGPLEAIRPGLHGLDVGSSSGAWLEVAGSKGMDMTGVELGEATAAGARHRGLDVRTGTLEQNLSGLEDGSFDLITFWDVLEHLPDPRRELSLAASLLAPGGLLVATFPNIDGWYPRVTYKLLAGRTGIWEYPELPVHLYDFAPGTAGRMLANGGYRVTALRTFATPFEFYRETSLSRRRLGGGVRGVALRLAFEVLKLGVYPAARLCGRGNSLFVAASRPK